MDDIRKGIRLGIGFALGAGFIFGAATLAWWFSAILYLNPWFAAVVFFAGIMTIISASRKGKPNGNG